MVQNMHNWITSFPDNFKWSNATLVCKGMAPYGAVSMEEIDRICTKLRDGPHSTDAWVAAWCNMADTLVERAKKADALGHHRTAGRLYLRAGNYYYTGERFVEPGERKLSIYRKALLASQNGLQRNYPEIEFIDVPYEKGSLAAYFFPASGKNNTPAPTIVVFDGMDNCKEMSVLFAGIEFSKRGFNTLAIDGPGQGESLRLRKHYARPDYEVAGRAAYDWVTTRKDVDANRVVVMGYSLGGYYAPRVASFEHRYAACVALGAMPLDYHARQLERRKVIERNPEQSSQSNFQLQFIFGINDLDKCLDITKKYTIVDCAKNIQCPVLIVHGACDHLTPESAAYDMRDLIGKDKVHLKIFSAEEGAFEHCQVDDRELGIDYISDWLEDIFIKI